ncbi:hypothetical protein QL285_020358 [Trifolium repens]|nr:hypothetical protein QL285_020358 [Trifolium repens]
MDRTWMRANRLSDEYEQGVMEFLQFAEDNLPPESNAKKNIPPKSNVLFLCPCVLCANKKPELDKEEIKSHLICNGICQNYTRWTWHGEVGARRSVSQQENVSVDMDDRLEDMMRDIGEDSFKKTHVAFMVHQFACGNRKKPTWIFPKTRVQPNGNDCGYYVMKNMIDIVSASVTKKWDEVFNDPTALSEDDLYELRNRWATCFLDLYNPENDYDDGDDDGAKGR